MSTARKFKAKPKVTCQDCGSTVQATSFAAHVLTEKCRSARKHSTRSSLSKAKAQEERSELAMKEFMGSESETDQKQRRQQQQPLGFGEATGSKSEVNALERLIKQVEKEAPTRDSLEEESDCDAEEEFEAEVDPETSASALPVSGSAATTAGVTTTTMGAISSTSQLPQAVREPAVGKGKVSPIRAYRDYAALMDVYLSEEKVLGRWLGRIRAAQNTEVSPKVMMGVKEFLEALLGAELYHLKSVQAYLLTASPGKCIFKPSVGRWGDPKVAAHKTAIINAYNLAATKATVLGTAQDEEQFDRMRIMLNRTMEIQTEKDLQIMLIWVNKVFGVLELAVHKLLKKPMPVSLRAWQPTKGYLLAAASEKPNMETISPSDSEVEPPATPASESI